MKPLSFRSLPCATGGAQQLNFSGHLEWFPRTCAVALISLGLLGCGASTTEQLPKEVVDDSVVTAETPEEELFAQAKDQFGRRLFTLAVKTFEALAASYPLGPYGRYAELKVGDCYFQMGQYAEAAKIFETYVGDHPSDSSTHYALYMTALSSLEANRGVGRDMEPVLAAKSQLEKFLKKYPDSRFKTPAIEALARATKVLAEHEAGIVEFYQKQELTPAFEKRQLAYQKQLNTLALLEKQATKTPRTLLAMRENDQTFLATIRQQERQSSGEARASLRRDLQSDTSETEQDDLLQVTGISCSSSGLKTITLQFDRAVDMAVLRSAALMHPEGSRTVSFESPLSGELSKMCFNGQISTTGDDQRIHVGGDFDRLAVLPMDNPKRLQLVVIE